MPAKVVSFINLKGGVGKSTLALAIGEILAFGEEKGRDKRRSQILVLDTEEISAFGEGMRQKVLLIDIDAQCNLSSALVPIQPRLEDLGKQKRTTYDMFVSALDGNMWDIDNAIEKDCSNIAGNINLNAIVCNQNLGQLDEVILDRWKEGKNLSVDLRSVLGGHLDKVKNRYNWIIIDCPPSLSAFTSNAILCSDYWIAPLVPETLSLYGIALIQNRISDLKNRYGQQSVKIEFGGSILNKVDITRGDHTLQAKDVYNNPGRFRPFDTWIGNWKPLYTVSDYSYPFSKFRDRYGNPCKWGNVKHKYGDLSTRRNNADNRQKKLLQNKLGLGSEYGIWNVMQELVKEFKNRCP